MVTAARKLKDTCSLEAFSVRFHCNKTLLYKTLEWLSLMSGPKAKSSSSEITNLTSFTISYNLGGSSGIFRTLKTLKSSSLSAFSDKHFLLYFTNSMVCLCEWMIYPLWSKWWALLCGSPVPCNDLRQSQKGEQCQETLNVPVKRMARNGQSVWAKLSFLGHFSGPFEYFIIA